MDALERLSKLVAELDEAELDVISAEAELEATRRAVRRLTEDEIPSIMEELDLAEVKLSSGLRIKIDLKIHPKQLTSADQEGLAWLRAHGQGGMIKTVLSVPFSAGSEDDARRLADRLKGESIGAVVDCQVHPQTLKAAVRQMLENGDEVDLKALKVHTRNVAKVVR